MALDWLLIRFFCILLYINLLGRKTMMNALNFKKSKSEFAERSLSFAVDKKWPLHPV